MASLSLSPPLPSPSPRLDLPSLLSVIRRVRRHLHRLLSDSAARQSLRLQCTSSFASSDHSVLSNLYWATETLELAIHSDSPQERALRIASSEKMLQVPALLDGEAGSTAGIENRYIVCCTYFYLSIVQFLKGDESQMTLHLLQCVLVSPGLVKFELAPRLWEDLFGVSAAEEAAKQQARRFRDWLMYYQVVNYGERSQNWRYESFGSCRYLGSVGQEHKWPAIQEAEMVSTLNHNDDMKRERPKVYTSFSQEQEHSAEPRDVKVLLTHLDNDFDADIKESFDIRCLQDMLEESQSDSPDSFYSNIGSTEASDSEARVHRRESPAKLLPMNTDLLVSNKVNRSCLSACSLLEAPRYPLRLEASEAKSNHLSPTRSHRSSNNFNISILDLREMGSHRFSKCYVEEETVPGRSSTHGISCFRSFSSKFLKKHSLNELVPRGSFARKRLNFSSCEKDWSEGSSNCEKDSHIELLKKVEKSDSNLCISDGPGSCRDADLEVMTLWELLNNKKEVKYSSIKQDILDRLIYIISTSEKEKVIRASVSILSVLISEDKTIIEDIKRKDLHLHDLASALKRNVHEAAILIYLLNPSPSEIKSLELLPALVEVACNSDNHREGSMSLPITPTSASIAMIEVLVTAFDYVTNNMHLAAISSPPVLSKLVNVAMDKNLEEVIALTAIFVRCMRLSGNCRKFLSQATPVDPFLHLLRSNERRAKSAALEYLHEILCMPRSSAIHMLHQIHQQGGASIMRTLKSCVEQAELEQRLLAAHLLLQLDMLESSNGKSVFREEAMDVLFKTVASEGNSSAQALSAFILSNLGGTYAWSGEPYIAAWLVKKAGLTSVHHKNMIRNVDWFDPCLQDAEMCAWSTKIAKGIIKLGKSVFNSLAKGLQSKIKSVQRDCLIMIAWLGSEMAAIGPSDLRYFACEILLTEVALFLHPGSELDERVLACLCIYNYTLGKGKQKLMNFSEGSRESLRRLSGVTWMAEELLKVTDYFLPTKPGVSCVHSQILELGHTGNGATTALIYFKGQLCAGFSDGSIKVWDIKGQRSMLVREVKEHKRPVTCFTLFEPADSLLSGSSDKTIRAWKMVNRKLECVEVIQMKEPVQKVDTCGDKILVVTQSRGLKVCYASRSIRTICKNKHVRSINVAQGKIYLGCMDSSIQEVDIMEDHNVEIRPPSNSWIRPNKPINSVVAYKGWVYCAGGVVEGSGAKEWKRQKRPQISITTSRRTNVQAMAVVEDFIYLNCSSSSSTIQVWLRGQQHQVGRLSMGSKITSLLTANDIVLCGTEAGLIKGWIPL